MISTDSRYVSAVIDTAEGPAGDTRQEMRVPFPRSRQLSYTEYRMTAGDRVDTVAYDFYGNAQFWWMIANANPEIIDWLDVDPGMIIRVPNA